MIVDAADVGPNDVILEVGTGAGAMTSLMAARGARSWSQSRSIRRWRSSQPRRSPGCPTCGYSTATLLANKESAPDPEVLDNVRAELAVGSGKQLKLVANLPYNVATPLIVNLLVHPEFCPALMVVTIQKELAERMCAQAATPAYGAVSVVLQGLADVSIVRSLPPTVFWPRPKVDSAVVAVRPDAAKRAAVSDVAWFHEIVRRLFFHRRKYIRHVLAATWRDRWSKAEVDTWLEAQGLSGQLRAESLNVDEFLALAKSLRERWAKPVATPRSSADAAVVLTYRARARG